MKKYLKDINPIVAIVILLLCLWAALFDEGKFAPSGIIDGGIPTYFLAKGLFCSSVLFILGKILLFMVYGKDIKLNSNISEDIKKES